MKVKVLSLAFALIYLPISLYYSWRLLTYIKADEMLWFLWWLTIPFAILSPILSKIAEWEN